MNTIKCSHCGYENPEYETYCLKCGRALRKTPRQPPISQSPPTPPAPPVPPISLTYKIAVIVLTFIIIVQVIVLIILRNNNNSSGSAIQPIVAETVFGQNTHPEGIAPGDETLYSSCCEKDDMA